MEYNLELDFNERERQYYEAVTAIITENFPTFLNNFDYVQAIISGGTHKSGVYYSGPGWAYGLAVKHGWDQNLDKTNPTHAMILAEYSPNVIMSKAKQLMQAIKRRKNLLGNTVAKYEAIVQLLDKISDAKTVIISESTRFADDITKVLNSKGYATVVYHSGLPTVISISEKTGKTVKKGKVRLKREALAKIESGEVRILATTKTLDRDIDIPDLKLSIIVSGAQTKEKNGRIAKTEVFSNEDMLIVNLYMRDTQDQKWVEKRQEGYHIPPVVIDSVDEIEYSIND